jgi:hypothetical protein
VPFYQNRRNFKKKKRLGTKGEQMISIQEIQAETYQDMAQRRLKGISFFLALCEIIDLETIATFTISTDAWYSITLRYMNQKLMFTTKNRDYVNNLKNFLQDEEKSIKMYLEMETI